MERLLAVPLTAVPSLNYISSQRQEMRHSREIPLSWYNMNTGVNTQPEAKGTYHHVGIIVETPITARTRPALVYVQVQKHGKIFRKQTLSSCWSLVYACLRVCA